MFQLLTVIGSIFGCHNCDTQKCRAFPVSVEGNPGRSLKHRAQALEISRTGLRTIVKKHLMFHPYKIMILQKILPHDPVQRQQFSEHILNILQNDLAVIITSKEAHFHVDGHVTKLNCWYWVKETPSELDQKSLHSQKVTLWFALSIVGTIRPYF